MNRYPLPMKVRFHLEALLNLGSIICGITGLVFYIRHQRHAHTYSSLVFYILTMVLYGIAIGDNYLRQAIGVYGINISYQLTYSWTVLLLIFSSYYVYVSGAMLALDRVLALSFPLRHKSCKISRNLTICGVGVCVTNTLAVCISNAIAPGDMKNEEWRWDSASTTYKIYEVTTEFYEIVFLVEVVLDVIFCVQFYRFHKKNEDKKHHAHKTNYIILFQIISQSLLCLLPKVLFYGNKFLFEGRFMWIRHYYMYYSFCLSFNVFLISFFIAYRFRPRKKNMISVPSQLPLSKYEK